MPEQIPLNEGRRLFGLNPQGYDARPDYPPWIFDYLHQRGALLEGTATLEIGAGPGKATKSLLEYGANPLTIVEPDARFAAILGEVTRSSATSRVIHETFEDAVLPDHEFDLVAAATSFHWIEPVSGLRKVKRLLRHGGFAALFWNVLGHVGVDDPFHLATKGLLAPLAIGPSGSPERLPFALDREAREAEAKAAGFESAEYLETRWTVTLATEQVGRLYESFSHIQRLDTQARETLLNKLMAIADNQFSGRVIRNVTSCLYLFS